MKIGFTAIALGALAMTASASFAQERSAGGPVETQVTWATLTNMIKNLETKVTGVDSRISQSVVCGNRGLIYGPGHAEKDNQGCVPEPDKSLDVFATKIGFDAGKSIGIRFNLAKGTYVVTDKSFHGNARVVLPKPLDINIVCGKKQRSVDVLNFGPWIQMPLAPGKSFDNSVNLSILQIPTCANGLVGEMRIYDPSGSNQNNQYSTGAIMLMKAE